MVTKEVCSGIQQKLGITLPDCEANAKKLWEVAAQVCPPASDDPLEAIPSPADIEKMFCKVSHNKMMEEMVTKEVCSGIQQKLVITIPDCEADAKKLWEVAAQVCPPASDDSLEAIPSPADIEKMFCKVSHIKIMEEMVTKEVCSGIQQKLGITLPDCEATAKKLWEVAAQVCPPASDDPLEAIPSPADIEKMFCKVSHN